MKYEGEEYKVEVNENKIDFFGKMGEAKYGDLSDFLTKVDEEVGADEFYVDIRKLEYANSSGIRTMAYFFVKSPKNIKIYIDENITWQRSGITPLVKMKPTITLEK